LGVLQAGDPVGFVDLADVAIFVALLIAGVALEANVDVIDLAGLGRGRIDVRRDDVEIGVFGHQNWLFPAAGFLPAVSIFSISSSWALGPLPLMPIGCTGWFGSFHALTSRPPNGLVGVGCQLGPGGGCHCGWNCGGI